MYRITTGQFFYTRTFHIAPAERQGGLTKEKAQELLPHVVAMFIIGCQTQADYSPRMSKVEDTYNVDMTGWPDGECFGDWFDCLMDGFDVQVDD